MGVKRPTLDVRWLTGVRGLLASADVEYRLTMHLGSGTVGYRIEQDRLIVTREKSGQRVDVPFSGIRAINLRQEMPGGPAAAGGVN
jgi:hypothetical protein